MIAEEIRIEPYRVKLFQAAIILNDSIKTVRRRAEKGEIEWSDGQITIASIRKYLSKTNGKRKKDENDAEVEKKIQQAIHTKPAGRRIISRGIE